MILLLLACSNTPGTFEDALGVPRADLADCTVTSSRDGEAWTRIHYDSRGYAEAQDNVDTDGNWIEGLSYSTELDEQERPVHAERSVDGDTWTEDWSYDGDSWRILEYVSGRSDGSSTMWTWTWAEDEGSATVTDGGDCEDRGTVHEGLRFASWERWCGEEMTQETALSWEDRLMGSVATSYVEGEPDYTFEATMTYDEDGRPKSELHSSPDAPESDLQIDYAWDCE